MICLKILFFVFYRFKNDLLWEKEIKKQNAEKYTKVLLAPEDLELRKNAPLKAKLISITKPLLNKLEAIF